jgi:hypothetical protein
MGWCAATVAADVHDRRAIDGSQDRGHPRSTFASDRSEKASIAAIITALRIRRLRIITAKE